MERAEVEHAIRAAAAVTNEKDLIIIGSQTIHGLKQELPSDLLESQELDCYAPQAPEKYALIDGALGEGSRFDETFGYHVDGVSPNTATLPRGWESRTVPFESANTGGADARMLKPTEVPEYKKTLELERLEQMQRARARTPGCPLMNPLI